MENPEISCPVGPEGSVGLPSTGSRTSEGVSAQAERFFVKGWDSVVGVGDVRVGFGAGSIYG